jgi:hypothetical protein
MKKKTITIIMLLTVGCSAPPAGADDAGACHVDEVAQAYDADAGAYAICHPDEVDFVCADEARMQAASCRWLGLGYNWCCPAGAQ